MREGAREEDSRGKMGERTKCLCLGRRAAVFFLRRTASAM